MMVFVAYLQKKLSNLHALSVELKDSYVGISSAAAIYAAIEVAKELGSGKKVLALAPDNGERYLSTTLYEFE